MFDINLFDDICINFQQCLLGEAIWIDFDNMVLRYEYDRLYVNGDLFPDVVFPQTALNAVAAVNEAIKLLQIHGISFIVAKDVYNEDKYMFTKYEAINSANITGYIAHGYRLVAVVSR